MKKIEVYEYCRIFQNLTKSCEVYWLFSLVFLVNLECEWMEWDAIPSMKFLLWYALSKMAWFHPQLHRLFLRHLGSLRVTSFVKLRATVTSLHNLHCMHRKRIQFVLKNFLTKVFYPLHLSLSYAAHHNILNLYRYVFLFSMEMNIIEDWKILIFLFVWKKIQLNWIMHDSRSGPSRLLPSLSLRKKELRQKQA